MKLLFFILVIIIQSIYSQELQNLTTAKDNIANYYKVRYQHDLDSVIGAAMKKIETMNFHDKDCAVFDVDETVLDNYKEIASMDFGYRSDLWDAWIYSAKAPAIAPVKKFYELLRRRGVAIVFLTGRSERHGKATAENLQNAGFTGYDTLIVQKEQGTFKTSGMYKAQSRLELEKAGYHILICVGDQESDFVDFHGPVKVKLPNFIYLVE